MAFEVIVLPGEGIGPEVTPRRSACSTGSRAIAGST
jgi:isocitrate/isopropylmalate dehydrogenase